MRRFHAALSTASAPTVIIAWVAIVTLAVVSSACVALHPPPPRTADQFVPGERALVDLDRLAQLRARADAQPDALELQWRAATAHVQATLRGHVDQRDHAERYLERAWHIDPEGDEVPAARVLARLLNMRSSVMDLDKLDLQIELYRSLLHDDTPAGQNPTDAQQFQFASFIAATEALASYDQGRTLAALRQLNALERAMQRRASAHPDDIDSSAMAGNFELTFAGVIPVGVDKRLRRGIDYLEVQQDHWQHLSPHARDTARAPNVRSVFALFLAEALLARAEVEAAADRYAQLIALDDQPDTAPRAQIVALARHRLANLDAYAGARELLPPWPSGVTGCVACHSREAELPTDDLHLLPGVVLR
ncbi:hypothetical protein [Enhygromyxa salina]|nr:hypothetical protein [Enhygromyxa salina]